MKCIFNGRHLAIVSLDMLTCLLVYLGWTNIMIMRGVRAEEMGILR